MLANAGSLYNNAQDFWHCVGWAFNCSVSQPARWKFWKKWLEYMLDVADKDWEERSGRDKFPLERDDGSLDDGEICESRSESILMGWLAGHHGRSANLKRIVKSLFADGSLEMLRMFPEVWENETKARKSESETQNNKKRKRLDIEKNDFGDYLADENVEDLANFSSSFPTTQESQEDREDTADARREVLGGSEAMQLRLRVMAMVSC